MPSHSDSSPKLGLLSCILFLTGAMIGSAIFSLSGLTMTSAGPASMISWAIAGFIMLAYGLFMGELACRYPKSGGVYVFPSRAYGGKTGRLLGWMACWSSILTNLAAIAFAAIYVGQYLSISYPCLGQLQIPIALISVLCCMFLNLMKINSTGKINAILVALLVLTIGIYVTAAFTSSHYAGTRLLPFFTQGQDGSLGFISAIPTAIIGYSGIIAMAFMVSDVHQPQRNVPRSMLISMGIVVTVYLLILAATLGLITAHTLQDSPGMTFIPLFCACFTQLQNIPWLTTIVVFSAVLALMTTMLVCISMNARAIQAASEDGILPPLLGTDNKNHVPATATIATCLISMIYACFPEYTHFIVNLGAIFNVIIMVITMLALLKARKNSPASTDQILKIPGGSFLPAVILLLLVACNIIGILNGGVRIWIYTPVALGVGLLIYCIAPNR